MRRTKLDALTLEDHLDDYCPKCKTKHDKNWDVIFCKHKAIILLECLKCEYLIYKKLDVMVSRKEDLFI